MSDRRLEILANIHNAVVAVKLLSLMKGTYMVEIARSPQSPWTSSSFGLSPHRFFSFRSSTL